MGYGGALIWTGLARNLKKNFPNREIVFVYTPTLREFLSGTTNTDLEIYRNNPDITNVLSIYRWWWKKWSYPREAIAVNLSNKKIQYWIRDTPDTIFYRTDGHAIEIACRPYTTGPVELATRLILLEEEKRRAQEVLRNHNVFDIPYICIEPNAKKTFTINKQWPMDHWQRLVTILNQWIATHSSQYKIVQIGVANSPVLDGVVDLTGTTTFREIKEIVDRAHVVVANEGGVAHLAASTKTPAVIISNPSLPLSLMAYPQHHNIIPTQGHHDCGRKKLCPTCQKLISSIDPDRVAKEIISLLP